MRKLGVLLVVSILLFVFGVGTFVYEFSQISPHQMDLSQETQTMTTSMPNSARLYTKTYLSSVGDVRVVVDEMIEDDKLQDDVLVITYPKMLHIVQDEDQLDLQMDDYEMSKDFQTLFNSFRIYFPKIDDTSDGISVTCLDVVQYDSSGEIIQQAERQ